MIPVFKFCRGFFVHIVYLSWDINTSLQCDIFTIYTCYSKINKDKPNGITSNQLKKTWEVGGRDVFMSQDINQYNVYV